MNALILAPFDARELRRLRRAMSVAYESWMDTRALADPDELAARIRAESVSMLVMEADFVFAETIAACPALRFVGVCRAATSHVDIAAASAAGVVVVNTPARNARGVAEHALALMLALARRIPQANEYVAGGSWRNPAGGYFELRGIELAGRSVGIVGMGAIGRTLAEMCIALGMEALAYDPYASNIPRGARMTDLPDLAARADFVSAHAPATEETAGMLDANFFGAMKRSAYFVNCADYRIADERALLDALRSKRIAGGAFDVFDTQPLAPHSPLLALDNVILTPHIAGATDETIARHSRMMANDMLRFANGVRPVNIVDAAAWERRRASV